MTLQDIRDDFVVKYKLECQKRGAKEIQFGDKIIAKWISDAQQDIQRRHNILSGEYTLIMIEDEFSYELPTDCSNITKITVDNVPLDRVNLGEMQEIVTAEGTPTRYAIKLADTLSVQFDLSEADKELTVYYDVDTNYASDSDNDWGGFNGKFYGSLRLPQRYNRAVVLYILSEIYDDILPKYEKEMNSLRESQYRNRTSTKYSMGGY